MLGREWRARRRGEGDEGVRLDVDEAPPQQLVVITDDEGGDDEVD